METLDIHSKGQYPSNVLSNFYPNAFIVDGTPCGSMEGFLQSLKYKNKLRQSKVCRSVGLAAKKCGKYKFMWKITGTVYWQGKKIKRLSQDFDNLIRRAYSALSLNTNFLHALKSSKPFKLIHSIGKDNPKKTVLTEREFIDNLNYIRDKMTDN